MPLQTGHYVEVKYTINHPSTEQTRRGKAISRKTQEGCLGLTWVFATKDISQVKEKFGRSVIEGHRPHPRDSELKRKQIGVNEITRSRELSFLFEWLIDENPLQDRKAVAEIEQITIANTDHLLDPWFKRGIPGGLNSADIEFVYSLTNDSKFDVAGGPLLIHIWTVVLN